MSQMKVYSLLTDEITNLGPPTENLDALLFLGEVMATGRDDLIVFATGPALQKWKDAE